MKPTLLIGVILTILGVVALAYGGFSYTKQETPISIGNFKVKTEQEKSVPIPPAVGIIAIAGGVVLIAVGAKKGA
ncbi:MAG: DUF3185 domain-containing protein [Chthoniobacteraceae bacterium]